MLSCQACINHLMVWLFSLSTLLGPNMDVCHGNERKYTLLKLVSSRQIWSKLPSDRIYLCCCSTLYHRWIKINCNETRNWILLGLMSRCMIRQLWTSPSVGRILIRNIKTCAGFTKWKLDFKKDFPQCILVIVSSVQPSMYSSTINAGWELYQ